MYLFLISNWLSDCMGHHAKRPVKMKAGPRFKSVQDELYLSTQPIQEMLTYVNIEVIYTGGIECLFIRVFPTWTRTFIEIGEFSKFSKFRYSGNLINH